MEGRQYGQESRRIRTAQVNGAATRSVSAVDLCAFPPPLFNLFPSKPTWITPAIHMPLPMWDDSLLEAFDLTQDDVSQAMAELQRKIAAISDNNDKHDSNNESNNQLALQSTLVQLSNVTSSSSLSPPPPIASLSVVSETAPVLSSITQPSSIAENSAELLVPLINLACTTPLNSQQFRELKSLANDLSRDAINQAIQIDTREWHSLMEFNARVAIVLLKAVLIEATSSADTPAIDVDSTSIEAETMRLIYLDILAAAPFTLRIAEIVLELAKHRRLDIDFMASYLSACMDTCSRQTNQETAQRTARLICVLLRSLIQDQFFDLTSPQLVHFRVEWQTFCLQFSKEKEAAAMYQMLTTN
ncbi:hypothetical protein BDF19DRAFT_438866 [Syncephalis fuscata]|nr:hypothetical protein BDF19DRAFT_438866 [Syncephalis fuscata]